jgi:hypothetical protein
MKLAEISTQTLSDLPQRFDMFLCACGYESRSVAVAGEIAYRAKQRVALGFAQQQELNYSKNRSWFERNEFDVFDLTEDEYQIALAATLEKLRGFGRRTLVVDISCMNRARLARLVSALQMRRDCIDVAFAYNLADFSPPAEELAPTTVVEPVIPEFAGWTSYPERPSAAIIGLGYEQSRAIGIVDHLEINDAAWVYIPRGPIPDYAVSVDSANQSLFCLIGAEGRRLFYDVMDPAGLFRELNSLTDSLKQIYNPLLIPFGPKIFALATLLVACMQEEVGVWRVSSGVLEPPQDRHPSQFTTVLRAILNP